jgi:hypothetical protein
VGERFTDGAAQHIGGRVRRRRRLVETPSQAAELRLVGDRQRGRAGGAGGDERVEAHRDDEAVGAVGVAGGAQVNGWQHHLGAGTDARTQRLGHGVVPHRAVGLPRLEADRMRCGEGPEGVAQSRHERPVAGQVGHGDGDGAGAHAVDAAGFGRAEQRPRRIGADAERAGRTGFGQHGGGLLVAQHQQVAVADDPANQRPRLAARDRAGADADEGHRRTAGVGQPDQGRGGTEQGVAMAAGRRVQLFEHRAAAGDDEVGTAQRAGHARRRRGDGRRVVAQRGERRRAAGDRDVRVVQRPAERLAERFVAGVTLPEGPHQ